MNENSPLPPKGDDASDDAPAAPPKAIRVRRASAVKAEASASEPAAAAAGLALADEEGPAAPRRRRRKVEVALEAQGPESAPRPTTTSSAPRGGMSKVAEPHLLMSAPPEPAVHTAPEVADMTVRTPMAPDVQPAPEPARDPAHSYPAPTAEAEQSLPGSAAGAPVQPRDDDDSPRGRRRNRRDRKRRDRGDGSVDATPDAAQGPEGDAAPRVQAAVAQAGELFAQVLSGAFDVDEGPVSEASVIADAPTAPEAPVQAEADPADGTEARDAEAHKRVLAAEPEAPKLHKVLAQAGVGSRRDMEEMILDGRITVNGEPAHVGQRISFGDQIKVNGKIVKVRITPPPARLVAYHKPAGEIVTHDDPQNRPTVYRRLPRLAQGKWQSIGRLDINTEGLLLFTNSGDLAHQLMHPRFGVEREYAVRVLGTLEPEAKARLLAGVDVEGQMANFRSIEEGGGEGVNRWYRVVITEGRNREVRKLFDAVGLTVNRLIRIRYGSVVLPHGLKRGMWVDLDENELRAVRRLAGGERGPRPEQEGERGQERGAERGPDRRGDRAGHPPRPRNDRGGHGDRPRDPQREPQRDHQRDPQRDPQRARPMPAPAQPAQFERDAGHERGPEADSDADHDFDPRNIPNPLEQTFDKRFVQNPRSPAGGRGFGRGGGGFGAGGSAPAPSSPRRGSGPKEPDPLQTSLGFIGADAFHRKSKGGRGGGGTGGGGYGGGGGGGGRRGR